MSQSKRKTFFSDFRTFFVRGLGILLPSILTIGLLVWAFSILHRYVAEPINGGVRFLVIELGDDVQGVFNAPLPDWYLVDDAELAQYRLDHPRDTREIRDAVVVRMVRVDELQVIWRKHWYLEAIGFVVAIIGIYLAGLFFGNLIGRRIYGRVEAFFTRLPVVKQVYPNVKQITDFLVGGDDAKDMMPSSRVVVVEYPRKGIWTMGLLTGESLDQLEKVSGRQLVTIFIPSSPTPFTGYTINVPMEDVWEIDITMDEVIRFVVSGGVLVPTHLKPKRYLHNGADGVEMAEIRVAKAREAGVVEASDTTSQGGRS